MKNIFLLAAISIALFTSCNHQPAKDNAQALIDSLTKDPSTYFHQVSTYRHKDGSFIATYFSPDSNWQQIKEKFLSDAKALPKADRKALYFVCYNDLVHTPTFEFEKTDSADYATILYSDNTNAYRSCGFDNQLGFWRFCYDGTRTDMGRVGDWQEIESLDSLNLD